MLLSFENYANRIVVFRYLSCVDVRRLGTFVGVP